MKKIFFMMILCFLTLCMQAQEYKLIENIPYRFDDQNTAVSMCTIDLYYPVNKKDFATVVWFHGGGLSAGRKHIPLELKNSGLGVVAVDYRLLPHVKLDDCIDDAALAVAWTFNHIAEYGGSVNKIFVSGHSAGGYLTNMIGLDKKWLMKYNIDADSIAALCPLSGHAISHFAYRQAKGLKVTQPSIDEYAPMYYVRPDAPPLIIISGDRELELFGRYEETAFFWRMMKVNGHKETYLYELDGFNHHLMFKPALDILKGHIIRICKTKK